jgi:hypothetical protein
MAQINWLDVATSEQQSFGLPVGDYDFQIIGDAGKYDGQTHAKVSESSFTLKKTKNGDEDPSFALTLRVIKDHQGAGKEGTEITEYFSLVAQMWKVQVLAGASFGNYDLYKQTVAQLVGSRSNDVEFVINSIIRALQGRQFSGTFVSQDSPKYEVQADALGVEQRVQVGTTQRVQMAWTTKAGTPPRPIPTSTVASIGVAPQMVQAPVAPTTPIVQMGVATPAPVAPQMVQAPTPVPVQQAAPTPVAPQPVAPQPVAPQPVAPQPVAPQPVQTQPSAPTAVESLNDDLEDIFQM